MTRRYYHVTPGEEDFGNFVNGARLFAYKEKVLLAVTSNRGESNGRGGDITDAQVPGYVTELRSGKDKRGYFTLVEDIPRNQRHHREEISSFLRRRGIDGQIEFW